VDHRPALASGRPGRPAGFVALEEVQPAWTTSMKSGKSGPDFEKTENDQDQSGSARNQDTPHLKAPCRFSVVFMLADVG
jgi:hypothetical protein